MADELQRLREAIDEVDRALVELVSRRAQLARDVGRIKQLSDAPVYRPEREAQVLQRIAAMNPGPLRADALGAIWREVISACRALERPMRVAYLGPAGTFSEQAMLKHFGHAIDATATPTIDEVFRATEAGSVDFGIVPVENSTEGAVNRSLDLFLQTPLRICGEVSVPVKHNLFTASGTLAGIRRICAHAQALAQCAAWLDRNCPGIERVPVASNAEGARVASGDPTVAAIAGDGVIGRYDVQRVAEGIQDDPLNRTRFVVIGQYDCTPSGNDQTSLILSVPDRAGAVHALIEPLARHGVSMKRFESRPARQGTWEYYFYIDIIGHQDEPPIAVALQEIRQRSAFYKSLGSYPRAA
ncbi:MAG TPA: prephenate dehydratase [Burkholderiaceae bacterium]|nr:prephenate dehydratase [Burkholderiaceae bacterium]